MTPAAEQVRDGVAHLVGDQKRRVRMTPADIVALTAAILISAAAHVCLFRMTAP